MNVDAVGVLLGALGEVRPDVEPLVAAVVTLAAHVDRLVEEGRFDDKAWREYRLALKALREAVAGGEVGSNLEDEFAGLDGAASVRNLEEFRASH